MTCRILVAVALVAAFATSGCATTTRAAARVATPATYLTAAQNRDGGFGASPRQSSSSLFTGWAALGLAAAGHHSAEVRRAIEYLRSDQADLQAPGDAERTMLVLGAAGVSARHFAGRNLVSQLMQAQLADGSITHQVNLTAFGILALRATGLSRADAAVRRAALWLLAQQNPDGGFGFAARGSASDVDDTGGVLQALAAAGLLRRSTRTPALLFLRHEQNPDGGLPSGPGGDSNAQSTAFAVQGLLAARIRLATWTPGGHSPITYLRSLVTRSGSVRYSRTSSQTPVWVTGQALLALARKPLPLGF